MLASDLKTGTIFKEDNKPYVVLKYTHVKVARGGATVRVKAKDILNGGVREISYVSSSRVEDADVVRKNAQYIYKDDLGYAFMDPDTYEQFTLSEDSIEESVKFLTEGIKVQVLYFEGNPVSIELPITLDFVVSYTEPGFKGNTVSNVYKDATLDNGAVVKVPSFIKPGDKVKIDTRTGEYVSKA